MGVPICEIAMSQNKTAEALFNRMWFSRVTVKSSDCGANADGGGGFQPGNTCGADGKSGAGDSDVVADTGRTALQVAYERRKKNPSGVANPIDIPLHYSTIEELKEAKSVKAPSSPDKINDYIAEIKATKIHKKVNELLAHVEAATITGDVRYASIEMNIECCPSAEDIKKGKVDFTPERSDLHDKIAKTMLPEDTRAIAGQRPVAVLLIGPPGAGKSSAGQPIIDSLGVKFALVNNDDVKTVLPEYRGWNAAMVHEESAMIVEDMVLPQAIYDQKNVVVDGVGNSSKKMIELANKMHMNGYDVNVVHVTIPTEQTVARAWGRFAGSAFKHHHAEPGRYVPIDYVAHSVGQNPTRTYADLKKSGYVHSWASYSNDVPRGTKPKLLDEGKIDG